MSDRTAEWTPPPFRRLLLLAFFLALASLFDAWMTLEFLAIGGEEMNPFMRAVLDLGRETFLIWKMALGIVIGFVFLFGSLRWRWAWRAFNAVVWVYLLLTALHLWIVISIR